jgi:energy-coupling factor transporter ATP-binding protein EcfA2
MATTSYIESVQVHAFLGRFDFEFQLDRAVNFFIGLNGTGKTTLINLLRSCLEGDGISLAAAPFSSVTMKFRTDAGQKRPSLTVTKQPGRVAGKPKLRYEFRPKARSKADIIEYDADDAILAGSQHYYPHDPEALLRRQVSRILRQLPNLTWLSIHRGAFANRVSFEADVSPIDRKIGQIVVESTKYLASLDSLYAREIELFQQGYFLSLVNARFESFEEIKQIDMDREKTAITHIFSELFKGARPYERSIAEHFQRATDSLERVQSEPAYRPSDFLILSDTLRLHKLVERWYSLQRRKDDIYRPKAKIVSILNKLLINKKFSFNNRNQPIFSSLEAGEKSRSIEVSDLSSGEKQVFIVLGSALLQEEKPYIYMADEPELSLHIEWQRQLVSNVQELNPSAQIIFATHSPDIVAGFTSNVIRMEELLGGLKSAEE